MKTGTKVAMVVTALIVLLVGLASGFFGFMMWALSLNGFMGQQNAVEISMIVYIALAVISGLIAVGLSVFAVYFFAGRREWHPVLSSALSVVVFGITTGVLHIASVVISAIVASELRTTR